MDASIDACITFSPHMLHHVFQKVGAPQHDQVQVYSQTLFHPHNDQS